MDSKSTDFDPDSWAERLVQASQDYQTRLWGTLRVEKQELDTIYRQYRALRTHLQKQRKMLFKDRNPIPLVPFIMAPLYVVRTPEMSPGEKICFLNLINYAQDKRTAWPSEKRQSADLQITTRQLQRHLRNLSQKGFIRIGIRRISHSVHVNQYELNLEDPRERSK
jgi:hypothetical protein